MWVNPEEHKIVGAVLSEYRKAAKLTQQALAARLGKPQSFVSAFEAGQRRIDVLELARIADAIGADPALIFSTIVRQRCADRGDG